MLAEEQKQDVNLAKRYRLLFKQDIQITEDKEFSVCIPLIDEVQ